MRKATDEMTDHERLDFEESQRQRADMERERQLDDYLTGKAREIFSFNSIIGTTGFRDVSDVLHNAEH